jgi:hypothetical protein
VDDGGSIPGRGRGIFPFTTASRPTLDLHLGSNPIGTGGKAAGA